MVSKNVKIIDVNNQVSTQYGQNTDKQVQSGFGSKWIKKIIGNKIKIVNNGAYEIERYPYDKKNKIKN